MLKNVRNVSYAVLRFAFCLMKDPGIGILKQICEPQNYTYMKFSGESVYIFKLFLAIYDHKRLRIIALESQ